MKFDWNRMTYVLPLVIWCGWMTYSDYQKELIIKDYERICDKYKEMFLAPVAEVNTSKKVIYFRLPPTLDADSFKLYSIGEIK